RQLRQRATPLQQGRAGPAGLRQEPAQSGIRHHRIQGDQLARPTPAAAGGHPGDLLLLASSGRERAAGAGGAGQPGRQPHAARPGAPHAEPGSPHPAHRPRNALPEVPDPRSDVGQASWPVHFYPASSPISSLPPSDRQNAHTAIAISSSRLAMPYGAYQVFQSPPSNMEFPASPKNTAAIVATSPKRSSTNARPE